LSTELLLNLDTELRMNMSVSREDRLINNAGHPEGHLLTERELARYLSVSLGCCRKWRLLRRGPAFLKLGSLVRYRIEDVHEWLSRRPQGGELFNVDTNESRRAN
jgi:excisionase family DNA binding protein